MKVRLELRTDPQNCGWIELLVFDAEDVTSVPRALARADGAAIRSAACELISRFKEMQDATMVALEASGLVQFADDVKIVTDMDLKTGGSGLSS